MMTVARDAILARSVPSGRPHQQNGEDVLLYRALRGVEKGCYIDVGAAEPEADSVTCAFYRRGWRGVNLEPVPATFERLRAARPNDINLNMAAGDQEGTTSFFLVDGGNGLSTAISEQMERHKAQGCDCTEIQVPVRTLASIVTEHVSGAVHFLKIDAEGSERAVLAGADFLAFRPWVILVEATIPNSQIPAHQDWEDFLLGAAYRFVWFDGLNRFYVAAEKMELAVAFTAQPNVFDGFVRRAEAEALAGMAEAKTNLAKAIARFEAECDAWTQERAALLGLAQQRQDEILRLRGEVVRNARGLAAMYESTSWKLTRPVRAVRKLLGRR